MAIGCCSTQQPYSNKPKSIQIHMLTSREKAMCVCLCNIQVHTHYVFFTSCSLTGLKVARSFTLKMNPLLFLMEIKQNKRQKNILLSCFFFFFKYLTWSSINLKSAYGSGFFCWAVVVSWLTVCVPVCRLRQNNYLKQGSCTNLPPVIHLFFLPPLSLQASPPSRSLFSLQHTHFCLISPPHSW